MSKVFGTNERLIVDDSIDGDGELNISMAVYSSDYEHVDAWLNKEQAAQRDALRAPVSCFVMCNFGDRRMKATIRPLKGKHYGTEIEVVDGSISTVINVWCNADYVPSDRELEKLDATRQDWDNNVEIDDGWGGKIHIRSSDIACGGHFESKWQHELCKKIVAAINT